jgi:sugar phosphate isomerase/epimerase
MIGTTSYGFRYLLLDPRRAPPLASILDQTKEVGLDCLQICENARPLELSAGDWNGLLRHARDLGLEIQLGCMTLDIATLELYLERAAPIPSNLLRIVLEEEGRGRARRDELVAFLDAAMPRLEARGVRLAIENHFHIPCRTLAEIAAAYPASRVGFCIDSANSLRNFESPEQVLDLLGGRGLMFHLKDYKVTGSNVGFAVAGAPLGTGDLDVPGFLRRALAITPDAPVFLENWVPSSGDPAADIAADALWLRQSCEHLRNLPLAGPV